MRYIKSRIFEWLLCLISAAAMTYPVAASLEAPSWPAPVLVLAAVFLLSRSQLGTAVLFMIGTLTICALQLLQYGEFTVHLLTVMSAVAGLFISRRFTKAIAGNSKAKPRHIKFAANSIFVSVTAAAAAFIVCFAIIRVMNPPTQELKLLTQLRTLPLLEQVGAASTIYIDDHELQSERPTEQPPPPAPASDTVQTSPPAEAPEPENSEPVRYYIFIFPTTIVLIAAAIGLFLILPPLLRRRRIRRMLILPPVECVRALYARLISKLRICGLPSPRSSTPMEYSKWSGERASVFLPLDAITEIFCETVYGKHTPAAAEIELLSQAYFELPSRCRKQFGLRRYLPRHFRL